MNEPGLNPLPALTAEEYEALKASIADRGVLVPVIVSGGPACRGEIGDGHHRLRACGELGIDCPSEPRRFESEAEFRLYQLDCNVQRRHLTVAQRIELGMAREPWERQLAAARKRAHGNTAPGRPAENTPASPSGSESSGETRERVAKAVGLKKDTYERGAKVLREAPPALADKLRAGEVTVNSAYMQLRSEQKRSEPPAPVRLPDGTFDVLYVDPPWQYDHNQTPALRDVENHYPTMTLEAMKALKPPAADDALMFMWATSPKLADALELVTTWGFSYVTCAVWVKDKIGMGYYFRQQHELLLVCKRGQFSPPTEGARPSSVIEAPRTRHSAKPHEVYDVIEQMYPSVRRVEMFARNTRDGWESWGNEAA